MKYAEIDLTTEFRIWQERSGWSASKAQFVLTIQEMVTNPQVVAERLRWCQNCDMPHDVAMLDNGEERGYCNNCWRGAHTCGHCGNVGLNYTAVMNDGHVCQTCLHDYYVYCRNCGLAYPHGEANEHLHGADGCCESPAKEFTVPYQGGALANDEVVRVEYAEATIPHSAIRSVVAYLADKARFYGDIYDGGSRAAKMYALATAMNQNRALVGLEDKTKEGSFVTRLKRYAYKNHALKLDPDVLTHIGNLVSTTTKGSTYNIAFTRDLNLPPAEFGNNNSCWWTDYKESRCALKSNGGMGMRDMVGERVQGRAWVMPVKVGVDGSLTPTFDAHSGLYLAFNGYGTLANEFHRVLMEVTGAEHWVTVTMEMDRYYVNRGTAKLIGPADVIRKWQKLAVTMSLPAHSDLFEVEAQTFGSAKATMKEKAHV